MEEHASIEVLWEEIEADIVDMGWHEFINRELLVTPISR
jgi:hypothetical protein